MGLLQKCLDYLEREEKKQAKKANHKRERNELTEIAKELQSPEYAGLLYPVNCLKNYIMTNGMAKKVHDARNNFPVSLNAMGFFTAALASELIKSDIRIDGHAPFIAVDSAIREDREQQEKIRNAAPEDRYKFASKSPHTNGSALDTIWMKRTEYGLETVIKTKDLLKDEHGIWLPQDVQERIKQEYFVHYDNKKLDDWQAHFFGSLLEGKAHDVISGFRQSNKNIWETSHVQLTSTGKRDPIAIEALFNVRWSDRFWAAMPFITIINDENWHWQLRRVWEQFFKPVTMEDYKKMDSMEILQKSGEILSMARAVADKPIYGKRRIVPNQRIALSKTVENLTPEELEIISSFGDGLSIIPNTRPRLCSKDELIEDLMKIEFRKHRAMEHALNMKRQSKLLAQAEKVQTARSIEEFIESQR